jgi:hypothetical protein
MGSMTCSNTSVSVLILIETELASSAELSSRDILTAANTPKGTKKNTKTVNEINSFFIVKAVYIIFFKVIM